MVKKQILVFIIFLTPHLLFSQGVNSRISILDTARLDSVLFSQGTIAVNSLLNRDFKTYMKYVHPLIIQHYGGDSIFSNYLLSSVEKADFTHLGSKLFLTHQYVRNEGYLQSVLGHESTMKVEGGTLVTWGSMIALSTDDGFNWRFINALGFDVNTTRVDYPFVSEELKIFWHEKPVFIPDKK